MPEYVDHFTGLASEGIGYLTWAEFDRFRNATATATKIAPWLRIAGYIKLGADPDELMSRSSHRANMPLGLPATWLAAEEIMSLMSEIQKWTTLEDVAKFAPDFATLLTREVERAAALWPMSDRPHAVQFFRCQACQQLTLRYYPPTFVGERLLDSVVKCGEKTCRAVVDEGMFARMALLIELEQKEKDERARRMAAGSRGTCSGKPEQADGVPVGEGRSGAVDEAGEGSVAVPA